MANVSYSFQVPKVGVVRVEATDMQNALMTLADQMGIKFLSCTKRAYKRPELCLVKGGNQSRVSNA